MEHGHGGDADYHLARWFPNGGGGRGAWLYSCLYEGRLWPVGYCSARCAHASPEEAEAHFREYLLDEATYDGQWQGVAYQCEVCGDWTDRFAQLKAAFVIHRLCRAHLNREGLRTVLVYGSRSVEPTASWPFAWSAP